MERRTIRQWLDILPEEIRKIAIENTKLPNWFRNDNFSVEEFYEYSFYDGLNSAFIFSQTKQGRDYWIKIRNEYGNLAVTIDETKSIDDITFTKEPFLSNK